MKVFKFGGASLESVERIRQVAQIVQSFPDDKILIVISAMAKTTNELEKVAENSSCVKEKLQRNCCIISSEPI